MKLQNYISSRSSFQFPSLELKRYFYRNELMIDLKANVTQKRSNFNKWK